jgi:hypothetical protein
MSQKQIDDSSRREFDASRRRFFKKLGKAAYVAPVILTLQATPSFAANGSICGQFQNDRGQLNKCESLFGQGS